MSEPPSIDEAFEKLCRLVEAARRLRARTDVGRRSVPVGDGTYNLARGLKK
jgi:hypothetical protein